MNIEINLLNATLKAGNMKDFHMTEVINGFFTTLKGESNTAVKTHEKPISTPKNDTPSTKIALKNIHSKTAEEISKRLSEIAKKIPKTLPKINDERTLTVSVAEALEAKEEAEPEQDHWKTGIKVDDDGTHRYRCYYWCDCGSKGKRYIEKDRETVTCRECDQELYVEGATPNYQDNGLPERDNFGNFFIAREALVDSD